MILVNLGCGPPEYHAPAPWVNVDSRPEAEPGVLADALSGLPWKDGTVDRVFAGHLLEHNELFEVRPLLAEIRRILVPGGEVALVGPDGTIGAQLLLDRQWITRERLQADLAIYRVGLGARNDRDPADRGWHRWACSGAAAYFALEASGFAALEPCHPRDLDLSWPVFDRSAPDQFAVAGVRR